MYPTLMIVPDLFSVEKDFRCQGFKLFNVDSVSEARGVVEDLRGIRTYDPVVLSDVSLLGTSQDVLLKFIEETDLRMILLASRDNLSSVLLSRMKRVLKDPIMIEVQGDDPKYLEQILTEGEDSISVRGLVENCPSASEFFWTYKRARLPVRQKLLELIMRGNHE